MYLCTIRTRNITQPYIMFIMFTLRCIIRSAAGKCVQSVHNGRSVHIVDIMRAALIGKYAAP